MPRPVDLVIFDCDGVLIDSETLSASVLMDMMAEIGLPITPAVFRSDFLGRSFSAAAAKTEARHGRALPGNFPANYKQRLLDRMRGNLHIMPGTLDLLQTLDVPYCLATSSAPERLAVSLSETGLQHVFAGRCFTANLVANGKPAPDLFLYTAASMGSQPGRCLVIEDSEMGLRAGLAAGMQTWHFRGGSHMADVWLPDDVQPHRTVVDMAELQRAFSALGLCKAA